jgi:hypothetical protein
MVRKSPDKQWNHQNSILFHETIPLKQTKILKARSMTFLRKKIESEQTFLYR